MPLGKGHRMPVTRGKLSATPRAAQGIPAQLATQMGTESVSLTPEKRVGTRKFMYNNFNGITTETFQHQLGKLDYES